MSWAHSGGPSWDGVSSSHHSIASNPRRTRPYLTTITNLGGILSTTNYRPTDSQILPNTSSHYRASTLGPATYVHHYEREVARWYARKQAKRGQPEHLLSCSVCLEPMEPSVWVRPTALCTHEPMICEPCLGQLVAHDVEQGLTEVCCPDVECRHQMDRRDVRGRICEDPACLSRYNTLVAQRELESQPNFMWCQNPQCGQGQVHHKGDASPLVSCYYCHSPACFTHRVPWHHGLTCEQYDLVIRQEGEVQANEDYIGTHTKQCPSCRRPIEKLNGCDHMTCRRPGGCGHEFCWLCLADYGPIRREGNHRHNSNCGYHTGNRASDLSGYSPGVRIVEIHRPPSFISILDPTSISESSSSVRVESPPAPMPLQLNDGWENRTSIGSNRPGRDFVWEPVTPPWLRRGVQSEELDRRTSRGQSINPRARRPSYAESSRSNDIVWQPASPPASYIQGNQSLEELGRRTPEEQSTRTRARRPIRTDSWQPPTPVLPYLLRANEGREG